MNNKLCATCGTNPVMHKVRKDGKQFNLCCRCYIATGAPPADWHPDCMKAYSAKLSVVKEEAA